MTMMPVINSRVITNCATTSDCRSISPCGVRFKRAFQYADRFERRQYESRVYSGQNAQKMSEARKKKS